MKEFTVPMSPVDSIPAACFAVASVILMRDLYNKMSKGAFALFAAGSIDVAVAGAMIFVGMMAVWFGAVNVGLSVLSRKLKKGWLAALFVLAWACMLAMGYLSARDFTEAKTNRIAQGVNIVGQGSFLLGAALAHKFGLSELRLHGGETA